MDLAKQLINQDWLRALILKTIFSVDGKASGKIISRRFIARIKNPDDGDK
jgi:hypothetical protein